MLTKGNKSKVKHVSINLTNALAGINPESDSGQETATAEELAAKATADAETAKAEETKAAELKAAEELKVAEELKTQEANKSGTKDSELVAHLKSEVATLTASNAQMIRDNANLTGEVAAFKAKLDALTVVTNSAYDGLRVMTQRLAVGLGMGAVPGLDALTGEALILQFNSVRTAFDKRFLSGGVATDKATEVVDKAEKTNSVRAAGVRAATSL